MATRVSISKALEAKLRQKFNPVEDPEEAIECVGKIVELLDEEQEKVARKRAAGTDEPKSGYKELVALFRFHLGDQLLTPPKPNTSYIVKAINKAREQGIDSTNVEQICTGYRRERGSLPARLFDLIWNADQYFRGGSEHREYLQEDLHDADDKDASIVFTGRPMDGGETDE